jgi:hypothetical protein
LNAFSVVNNNSIFYGSLCETGQDEEEPESENGESDNKEDF